MKNIEEQVKEILTKTKISFKLAEDSKTHAIYTMNTGEEFDSLVKELSTIIQKEREEAYKKVKAQLDILHDKKQSQLHGGYDDADFLNAYCMALSDAEDAIDNLSQTKGDKE